MTSIVINGNPYSDDGSTVNDMQHYGYLTHLLPMIGDTATVAGEVQANADQVAIDAANAMNAAEAVRGTSTTSLSVAAGNVTLTTQANKQFPVGGYVTISRTSAPTTLMHGVVTSYAGTTLQASISTVAGPGGPFTDWSIALSGAKGNDGATGNGQLAYLAKSGTYTVTAADKGSIIDCTGTFTLSFQSAATLGNAWTTYIRNSGVGVVTLDPNGTEMIDVDATFALNPGSVVMVQCDGATLRKAILSQYTTGYLHVRDEKASGTAGGDSSTGSNTRTLNASITNTIAGASVSANKVTLPPGKYICNARAPAYVGDNHKLTLYNETGAANLLVGASAHATVTGYGQTDATVYGQFTLSVSSLLRLSHWIQVARASNGLGSASGAGVVEVYAELQIWRIA